MTAGGTGQGAASALSDGAGGAYIGISAKSGGTSRAFLKHIASDGTLDPAYEPTGVQVGYPTGPALKDGPLLGDAPGGGLFVAWQDDSVRVQCMAGTSPAPGWPAGGIAVCGPAPNWTTFDNLRLSADGTGTAHLFWHVGFEQIGGSQFGHAAVSSTGTVVLQACQASGCYGDRWNGYLTVAGGQVVQSYYVVGYGGGEPASDIVVTWSPSGASRTINDDQYSCLAPAHRSGGVVVPSIGDHVIAAFDDGTAQRFSPTGITAQWAPVSGPAILPPVGFYRDVRAGVSDGAGGALFAFSDGRELLPGWGLTVQAVDATGAVPAGWATDGTYVVPAAGFPQLGGAVSDGAGGAVLGWSRQSGSDILLYAQRVRAGGGIDPDWAPAGAPVSAASGSKYLGAVVTDGFGGALLVWTDYRNGGTAHVYAQRVSAGGTVAPVVGVSPTGPTGIRLSTSVPNPTRGVSSFTLELPQPAAVGAHVVSLAGRSVAGILTGETLPAGANILRWDGRNRAGIPAPPGIYFLDVTVGNRQLTSRIVRLP